MELGAIPARGSSSRRDVDLGCRLARVAESRIDLDAELRVRRAPSSGGFPLEGDAALHLLPSSVAGFELPKGEGSLEISPAQLEVHARMQEPGIPIDVDVRVDAHAALEVSAQRDCPFARGSAPTPRPRDERLGSRVPCGPTALSTRASSPRASRSTLIISGWPKSPSVRRISRLR